MTSQQEIRQSPDIERAACTILAQSHPRNHELATWVRLITSELDYQDDSLPAETYTGILSRHADGDYAAGATGAMQREMDRAIALLAHAVIRFRHHGRPAGDVESVINYGSEPILYVQTSLAANVAEYANRVREAAFNNLPWPDEAE